MDFVDGRKFERPVDAETGRQARDKEKRGAAQRSLQRRTNKQGMSTGKDGSVEALTKKE